MAWDKKAPFDAKGNMLDWDGYYGETEWRSTARWPSMASWR